MRRLHINAGELIAKAHERGFDSLSEVDSAVLYPNGTIYFRGRSPRMAESARLRRAHPPARPLERAGGGAPPVAR